MLWAGLTEAGAEPSVSCVWIDYRRMLPSVIGGPGGCLGRGIVRLRDRLVPLLAGGAYCFYLFTVCQPIGRTLIELLELPFKFIE